MESRLRPRAAPLGAANRMLWSIHMRPENGPIKRQVFAKAEEMGVTVSSLVFEALREYLERHRDGAG
jgi:hypothetical protein